MIRRLHLSGGERVLDLGCGQGATAVFLAKECAARVVAVDLWVSSTKLHDRFQRETVDHAVVPLNLDITGKLPFAEDYFDAIFCMDSIHYYGGTEAFWQHLLPHLKPGGRLCIGSPCFSEEFSAHALAHLPSVYDDGTDLWPREFSRYHSPSWWRDLLTNTGLVRNAVSEELEDGVIFWEDDVLYHLDHGGALDVAMRDADQYTFRLAGMPYLTHFLLSAERTMPNEAQEDTARKLVVSQH
jgi:SAM-dependent methyltransferase